MLRTVVNLFLTLVAASSFPNFLEVVGQFRRSHFPPIRLVRQPVYLRPELKIQGPRHTTRVSGGLVIGTDDDVVY